MGEHSSTGPGTPQGSSTPETEPPASAAGAPASASLAFAFDVRPGDEDAFEQWRWAVSPLFDVELPTPAARASYVMKTRGAFFSGLAVSRQSLSASRFERTRAVQARSGSDQVLVSVYLDAPFDLDVEGRTAEVAPGDIALLDMSRRGGIRTPGGTSLSLTLPRAVFSGVLDDVEARHGAVLRRGTPLNGLLIAHLRALEAESLRLGGSAGHLAAQATAGLLAACFGDDPRQAEERVTAVERATLGALRRAIEADLANPNLGPEALMRAFGVSRATLYRLFEPLGGVAAYIQSRRLSRAFRRLADPLAPPPRIGTVARALGFRTANQFGRAFRDAYGMSPRDLRVVSAPHVSGEPRAAKGDEVFTALNRWMLGVEGPF